MSARSHRWTKPVGSGFPHVDFWSARGVACKREGCKMRQRMKPCSISSVQISRDDGATWEDLYSPETKSVRPMPPCAGA